MVTFSVGQALRLIRKGRGRNQIVVAQAAGISSAILSHIENDLRPATNGEMDRLLNALGASMEDLAHLRGISGEINSGGQA